MALIIKFFLAQCFAKCNIDGSGIVNTGGALDVDQFVAVSVAYGQDGDKARSIGEKCKSLYTPNSTCDQSYRAYRCAIGM